MRAADHDGASNLLETIDEAFLCLRQSGRAIAVVKRADVGRGFILSNGRREVEYTSAVKLMPPLAIG
jgi:hypothetical protein